MRCVGPHTTSKIHMHTANPQQFTAWGQTYWLTLSNRASLCQLSVCSRYRNGAYLVQRSHVCDAGSGSSHSSWTVWAWGQASDMGIMHCGSCWSGITGARRCSTWDRRCVEPAQRPLLWSTGVTPASMSLSACGTACVKAAAASLWALPQSLH